LNGGKLVKVVYKLNYPNGKIYVAMDLTGDIGYFGSPDRRAIELDFTAETRRDMTIRREILWESETASDTEVRQMERQHIEALRANDPAIGYNLWPKPKGQRASAAGTHI
jgi:hypothetical protein